MSTQPPTTTAETTLAVVFAHLSKSLQDINLAIGSVSQRVIAQKNEQNFQPSPVLVELQDIVSKVSTCQSALVRAKEMLNVQDLAASVITPTEPDASTLPQPVVPNTEPPEYKNFVPGQKVVGQSFYDILLAHVSTQVIFNGRGRLDPSSTSLGKFAESLMEFQPDQITDWPDGWYSAVNPEVVELLLTLEPVKDTDAFKPKTGVSRIHVHFRKNLRALKTEDIVSFRFTDSQRWLREEHYTESVLKMIKFNLMIQLTQVRSKLAAQAA